MTSERASVTARVTGRVQAVGFRYFTQLAAEQIGVCGYAMNCSDGSVEVIAEGERDALEQFLRQLERGPSGARVERVEESWGPYTGQFTGFGVRFGR